MLGISKLWNQQVQRLLNHMKLSWPLFRVLLLTFLIIGLVEVKAFMTGCCLTLNARWLGLVLVFRLLTEFRWSLSTGRLSLSYATNNYWQPHPATGTLDVRIPPALRGSTRLDVPRDRLPSINIFAV